MRRDGRNPVLKEGCLIVADTADLAAARTEVADHASAVRPTLESRHSLPPVGV